MLNIEEMLVYLSPVLRSPLLFRRPPAPSLTVKVGGGRGKLKVEGG